MILRSLELQTMLNLKRNETIPVFDKILRQLYMKISIQFYLNF